MIPSGTGKPDVLCPCLAISDEDIPNMLDDPSNLFPAADLYFCAQCSSVRCPRCYEFEVISKYCARCNTQMKLHHNHCVKNCFCCPVCNLSLAITSKDITGETGSLVGKQFIFECPTKHYSYDTGVITKPRSLYRIIKGQLPEKVVEINLFDDLSRHYEIKRELTVFQEKNSKMRRSVRSSPIKMQHSSVVSSMLLAEFAAGGKMPVFGAVLEDLDKDTASANQLLTMSIKSGLTNLKSPLSTITLTDPASHPPLNQLLASKRNIKCKKCSHKLIVSDPDPVSSKFNSNFTATEILPDIEFLPIMGQVLQLHQRDINLLVNFVNSINEEVEITVSSYEKVLLTSNLTKDLTHKNATHLGQKTSEPEIPDKSQHYALVIIPCSKFHLGARPTKMSKLESIINTIPTTKLTRSSQLSKSELFKRSAVIPRLSTPLVNNTSEKPLDQGVNWCTIPLNIRVYGDNIERQELRVPFFISVKSASYRYGFWISSQIGEISFEN